MVYAMFMDTVFSTATPPVAAPGSFDTWYHALLAKCASMRNDVEAA